jgi:hypothetical protein
MAPGWRANPKTFLDVLTLSLMADGGNGLQMFDALRSDILTRVLSCCDVPSCLDERCVGIVVCWGRCDR